MSSRLGAALLVAVVLLSGCSSAHDADRAVGPPCLTAASAEGAGAGSDAASRSAAGQSASSPPASGAGSGSGAGSASGAPSDAGAGPGAGSASGAASAGPVPAVQLVCFDGGAPASLTSIGKPTIVNLWAAWCEPCRTELPAIQQFADRAGDRVKVIGVATADSHASAQSFIEDNKLTITMLEDPDRRLLTAVRRSALPATLFITADGRLAFVYNSTPLDVDHVAGLAEQYLGVTVPA